MPRLAVPSCFTLCETTPLGFFGLSRWCISNEIPGDKTKKETLALTKSKFGELHKFPVPNTGKILILIKSN